MLRVLIVMLCVSGIAVASDDDAFLEHLRARGIQTELPGAGEPKRDDPNFGLTIRNRPSDPSDRPKIQSRLPIAELFSGPWIQAIAWTLLITLIALGIIACMPKRRGDAPPEDATTPANPNASAPRETSESDADEYDAAADRLAADGRFDRAIHALLLGVLVDLSRAHGNRVRSASTSREIVRTLPLIEPKRSALARLVACVESSHFGVERPDRIVFESCVSDRDLLRSRSHP